MFDQEKAISEELCAVSRQLSMVVNNICNDVTIFHEYVHAEPSLDDVQNLELNFNTK